MDLLHHLVDRRRERTVVGHRGPHAPRDAALDVDRRVCALGRGLGAHVRHVLLLLEVLGAPSPCWHRRCCCCFGGILYWVASGGVGIVVESVVVEVVDVHDVDGAGVVGAGLVVDGHEGEVAACVGHLVPERGERDDVRVANVLEREAVVHHGLRDLVGVRGLDGVAGVAPVELEHGRYPRHVARLDELQPPHRVPLLVGLEVEVELRDTEHVPPPGVERGRLHDAVHDLLDAPLRAEREALGLPRAGVCEHHVHRVFLRHVLLDVEQTLVVAQEDRQSARCVGLQWCEAACSCAVVDVL